MINVVLLGTGNVATHLYKAFKKTDAVNVVQLYSRTVASLKPFEGEVGTTSNLSNLVDADVFIISIPDDAIASLSKQIPFKNRLMVHTSGSVDMLALNNNHRRGVFYPLQTFSKNKDVNFATIPLCLEAENQEDLKLLLAMAKTISNNVHTINSGQRRSLHLAAVFVNNFVNHLYEVGNEICSEKKVPFEILRPLIEETAKKIIALSPKEAQTGPAKRHDEQTIQKHIDQLNNNTHKAIYRLLTESIQKTYGRKEL